MNKEQKERLELFQFVATNCAGHDPAELAERAYRFIIDGPTINLAVDDAGDPLAIQRPADLSEQGEENQLPDLPDPGDNFEDPGEQEPDKLSDELFSLWIFIYREQRRGKVQAAHVATHFGFGAETARRRCVSLQDMGYIKRSGRGRGTHYFTSKVPPGVTIHPEVEPPDKKPAELDGTALKRLLESARKAADWMQWCGYPVTAKDGGRSFSTKGMADEMTPEQLITWANMKRTERGEALFDVESEAAA